MISFACTNVASRKRRNKVKSEMTKGTESNASAGSQSAPTMDWGTTVRPLLAASYGNVSTNELLKLARTLTNSRQELLSHGAEFAPFYSSLVALSAHFLSGQISNVPRGQLSTMTGACRVIIEYMMTRLDVSDEIHRVVGWTQLGMLINGLCTGQASLHRSDVITLVARMKSSHLPVHIRNTIGPDKSEDDTSSPTMTRPRSTSTGRSDPLSAVFDSLVLPLTGLQSDGHRLDSDSVDKDSITSSSADAKDLFISTNIQNLLRFEGPTKFLDMFLAAHSIGDYVGKYSSFVDGATLALPDLGDADACAAIEDSLPSLSADLSLLEMLLELPLYSSIGEGVVGKLCKAVGASLVAAASVVLVRHRDSLVADESDEEARKQHKLDGACRAIAATSLNGIHRRASTSISLSPDVDSSRADCFNAATSLVLAAIVDHMTSVVVCPTAAVLDFSERLLAIAPLLMRSALADVGARHFDTAAVDGALLNPSASAAQKLASVCARIPLVPLFIRMARDSLVQTITNQQMLLDAEIAHNDVHDSTDDSDTEHTPMSPLDANATLQLSSAAAGAVVGNSSMDSEEPILGTWLEDLLSSVPALVDEAMKAKRQQSLRSAGRSESVGNGTLRDSYPSEKRLLSLCCESLRALNNNLIGSSSVGEALHAELRQSITSETVERLADMILRLYFHTSKNAEKARDFRKIHTELARFVHNALVNKYMTTDLQNELIFRLLDQDLVDGDAWPLSIPPPALTVLGQTLFLRLHSEHDDLGRSDSDAVVVGVWTRFINALDAAARRGLTSVGDIPETPNVEHVQLLLLLFHALQLMQKKTLLLQVAGTISAMVAEDSEENSLASVRISPHLGHLLLIFDYMLRHLYEPSTVLLEQAQINVFPNQTQTDADVSQLSLMYEPFADPCVVKCFPEPEKNCSPAVYELTKLPVATALPPKVDGLAVNFLLSWTGYDDLYSAIILLTNVHPLDGASNVERASVRYARTLAWRCAGLLPLSVGLFQRLESDVAYIDAPMLAHLLRVESRFQNSAYCKWLTDCLVKQEVTEENGLGYIGRAKELLSDDFVLNACCVLLERTMALLKSDTDHRPQSNFSLCMTAELALRRLSLYFAKYQNGVDVEYKPSVAERNVAILILRLVQQLGSSARGLIAREAKLKSAGESFDVEMASELLNIATNASNSPYNVDSWPQLLQSMPDELRQALANWDKVGEQFVKSEKKKSPLDDDLLNPPSIEKQLSSVVFGDGELNDSVMGTLAETYGSACDLLMPLTAVFRSAPNDCFSPQQVEDAMLGVMFTLVTRSTDAENANTSLVNYVEYSGVCPPGTPWKEYCEERQMYHFLTHIVRLLGLHSDSNTMWHSRFVPLICERLCKLMKNASNWTVVTNFFRQSADGANLTPSLLKRYQLGQTTPLTTIAFMRLVSELLDQLTSPQSKTAHHAMLTELHRVMIEPLLRSEQLLRQWIIVYKSILSDEGKVEMWFLSLLSNAMHLLDGMPEASAAESAKSLLNTVIDELLDALPKKMPPLPDGTHLPKSDRWLDSALTPVRVDGTDCPLPATQLDQRFCSVFTLCVQMANANDGVAHVRLLALCKKWLLELGKRITVPASLALMEGVDEPLDTDLRTVADLDTAALILSYIAALVEAVKPPISRLSSANLDYDSDWPPFDMQVDVAGGGFNDDDIGDDEESGAEDSGEESGDSIDERTCTFTRTQKEFMNQHWYHCHTCGMVDGEGVCTTCAKVCHKDHDMSYSKFGSFFCDCGARADGRCQALMKRARRRTKPSTQPSQSSAFAASTRPIKPSTLKSTTTGRPAGTALRQIGSMCTLNDYLGVTLHVSRNALSASARQALVAELTEISETGLCQNLLRALSFVIPMLTKGIEQRSPGAAFLRRRLAIESLHGDQPISVHTDRRLFTPMFSSQGAVFDGVKLNLAAEQGQIARQLLQQSQTLQRTPMTLIDFPDKKRQFIAVTYDRCKLTVVQANSLMKQVESKRRKLQPTRVALETMPFTVISLSSQEECVAVCGIKEFTVLVFSSSGTVADRIQLTPPLDAANMIIKAEWCRGVRGLLALVTADFISVYDLKVSSTKPRHQFVIPVGNIRDVSFVMSQTGEQISLLILSSVGYVYLQQLNEQCLLEDDASFFVTNSVMIDHAELTENQGTISDGGISIHYSHALKLVFVSYAQGKNLVFPFDDPAKETITNSTLLPTFAKKPDGSALDQPLVGWTECPEHPGVVVATSHTTFSPYVVYSGQNGLFADELPLTNKLRAFCILLKPAEGASATLDLLALGEDGVLQVFESSTTHLLDYWLVPPPQAGADQLTLGTMALPRQVTSKRRVRVKSSGPVVLPVDFFESCLEMREVLFSSRELQHAYEPAQIKNRLATNNLYVACSATGGFELVIRSIDPNMVICGLRVELGKTMVERTPTYVQMCGRRREIRIVRPRWFDLPMTREETLATPDQMTIRFGPSASGGMCIVDSVKVYGKTKESFGWTEEAEEVGKERPAAGVSPPRVVWAGSTEPASQLVPSAPVVTVSRPLLPEVYLMASLKVLDRYFDTFPNGTDNRKSAIDLTTGLLPTVVHPSAMVLVKSVLRRLFPTKEQYCGHKDRFLLLYVWKSLALVERDRDWDLFDRLLLITREVAIYRPTNLLVISKEIVAMSPEKSPQNMGTFIESLMRILWKLIGHGSANSNLQTIAGESAVTGNRAVTIRCLVDVLHAFMRADSDLIPVVAEHITSLLLCEDVEIGQHCKLALLSIFRPKSRGKKRVVIPSPPQRASPAPLMDLTNASASDIQQMIDVRDADNDADEGDSDNDASIELDALANGQAQEAAAVLLQAAEMAAADDDDTETEDDGSGGHQDHYELLAAAANGGQLEQLLADGPDDDAAMMELAIALSLQDSAASGADGGQQNLPPPPPAESMPDEQAQEEEQAQMSDTTVEGESGDEEGSTAATDGSNLRTSPTAEERSSCPEPPGSCAASESGASGGSVSGRSSTYGETGGEPNATSTTTLERDGPSNEPPPKIGVDRSADAQHKTTIELQSRLLLALLDHLPTIDSRIGGMRSVAFLQTVLMLIPDWADVDSINADEHKQLLCQVVDKIMAGLDMRTDVAEFCERGAPGEVNLLKLRLLSVFLFKAKSRDKTALSEGDQLLMTRTARLLIEADAVDYCRRALSTLLVFWKAQTAVDRSDQQKLLPRRLVSTLPDLSPLFLPQYVREHSRDVFECYTLLLTEMALRLPYQIKKVVDSSDRLLPPVVFDHRWEKLLCEYVSCQEEPNHRRQARKLLMVIAGTKDGYRFLRDKYQIAEHMAGIRKLCALSVAQDERVSNLDQPLSLDYEQLSTVVEKLRSINEVAVHRSASWQRLCAQDFDDATDATLPFLVRLACVVPEVMSEVVLDLIVGALSPSVKPSRRSKRADDGTVADSDANRLPSDAALSRKLAGSLIAMSIDSGLLTRFLNRYLLQSNVAERRWQAHSFVRHLFDLCSPHQQSAVLDVLWKELWPKAAKHGVKASHLVDLLTVFLSKLRSVDELTAIAGQLLDAFRRDVSRIETHPNANLYSALSTFLDTEMGYYLEQSPCLVCNHPEIPMSNMKLSTVKLDSRSTTTSQIFKLTGSHELSRVTLKLSELKRNKMIKRLNLYYCNKPVGSAVELKNRPELWSKAHTVQLAAGQTEVKIEVRRPLRFRSHIIVHALVQGHVLREVKFLLPIVACNLMIDFVEFYEAQKPASELVHCPRCSASVPAHPGVCANCGENVYQCAKCRSINYDEKDPFLCNSCGYSKYAKFDFSFFGRQIASVEPIENDEGRQKMSEHIDSLLTQADNNRRQLRICRSMVEAELAALQGQSSLPPLHVDCDRAVAGEALGWSDRSKSAVFAGLNQHVHSLTVVYTSACKLCFDKLTQRIQQILANRAELIRYDALCGEAVPLSAANSYCSGEDCFGCITAQAVHCLVLLQGLARNVAVKRTLMQDDVLIGELMTAMRKGPRTYQRCVESLIVHLCTGDERGTNFLCATIEQRVLTALRRESPPQALAGAIQHELNLLRLSLKARDGLWERRLRTVFHLFLSSLRSRNTAAPEYATLPCMELIRSIVIVNDDPKTKRPDARVEDIAGWLAAQAADGFGAWKSGAVVVGAEAHEQKLERKYGHIWLTKCRKRESVSGCSWLERALFCHSTYTRAAAAALFKWTASGSDHRTWAIISLLISNVDKLDEYGERSDEFVALARSLVADERWMLCLANRGFLVRLCAMIDQQVERLGRLEDGEGASDLTEGYVVRIYSYLLSDMLAVERIRNRWKQQVLGAVLHGYLGLRRLLIHRTKLIDDSEKKLLSLLEELTSGTEKETREFMAVCLETVQKYSLSNMRTPALIFERLCSMIDPKEKDVGDFLINIEKDPAQEDFLQGRMQGNPYNSKEPGMGPLMRDMKNRICRDCELVALLQDDTGMELLVNNKIVSLDLPVAEVYRKLWQPQRAGEAMLVVYRMRGLLGDATEEFIETLDTKKDEQVDEEMAYPLAAVLGERDGLKVMLTRLRAVSATGSGRHLLTVLIKLFGYCVKIRNNRTQLLRLGAVGDFLQALRMMLDAKDKSLHAHAEEFLDHMNALIVESAKLDATTLQTKQMTDATPEQIIWLLELVVSSSVLSNQSLKDRLTEIVPNLALGSEACMEALIAYFKPVLDFNQYDMMTQPHQTTIRLDTFCAMTRAIQVSPAGDMLKDKMLAAGVVREAAEYLGMHHPPLYKTTIDSPEWKEFLAKPSLKYVLRLLAGLAHGHAPSQIAVAAADCIPIIHRLEQISTEERLGSLAENVLEALRENTDVANKIEAVRQETKQKKKQMAMAMRDRQLMQMGMTMGAKGQVKVSTPNLKEVPELKDEGGVVCSICREGYKSQPQKALGVYTFSKRVNVEEFDQRPIKQAGYSTVSHMNLVHLDCHQQAVKSARGREEWESAALHNANTRCNGLLPLWGPQVPDAHFAACLARFNSDIQTQTGCSEVSLSSSVHDLKLLLLRFAESKSFSEETRGGGKESNMQLVPCILSLALYLVTTARLQPTEMRHLIAFLDARPSEWVASAYQPEGPLYMTALCLTLLPCDEWKSKRVLLLRRLLVLAQARHVAPTGASGPLPDASVKDYSVYRSALLFFSLIDAFYSTVIKSVSAPSKEKWAEALLAFVRENDAAVFDSCGQVLSFFEEQVAVSESFAEFCDVVGLNADVENPDEFLQATLLMAS